MGEKDLTQKQLADYEDIFADIVNVLLLDGQRLIKPDELKPAKRESLYKDKGMKLRMQERDIAKFWEKGGIRLAFIGLEDQTKVHRAMPLRVIGYDGAVYRDELNAVKPKDEADASPPTGSAAPGNAASPAEDDPARVGRAAGGGAK